MIRKRQVLVNALLAVVQVVVTGLSFFVLYRFVKDTVGIERFGIWALVLATAAAGRIADLGLASSAVKFVSQYLARERPDKVAQVVQTSILSLGVFFGAVSLLLYPVFVHVIGFFIEAAHLLPEALALLPYALLSFWVNALALVVQSCIDGHQRVDLRSLLGTVGTLCYLGFAFWLVPEGGLIGLAQAQVLQALLLLIASWIVLRRLLPRLPLVPHRWSRSTFKEMLHYSLNFQVVSVSYMLLEPATKALMSKFGGAAALGYFEFAYRMVFQLRALIIAAHQSIVPTIADLYERQPDAVRDLYTRSMHLLVYLVVPALTFFIALTPLVSRLWIGSYEPAFVLFATLLFVGWFLNIASGPAYFANLGTGHLRWNVIGHLTTGVLNIGLGLGLGWWQGGTGVVLGFVVALLVGSALTAVAYQREHGIPVAALLQRESLLLGAACLVGMALGLLLYHRLASGWPALSITVLLIGGYLAVVALPLWKHPMRGRLQDWLGSLLRRQPAQSPLQ